MERKAYINDIYQKTIKKVSEIYNRNKGSIPYIVVDGKYTDMAKENICWWTNGFWAGILWQTYHATKDEVYLKAATESEEMLEKAFGRTDALNHDVGFMWLHTSVARYRLTKAMEAKERGLRAADFLKNRFCVQGEYIRAWNKPDKSEMIVDCLMNLPLLYWAEAETNNKTYGDIARKHLNTAAKYLIREDGSCNHIVEFNTENGDAVNFPGGQGYAEGSAWTRGQAWAIYGMALAYRYTENTQFLSQAKKVAHYFIANIALTEYVSVIDFRAPQEPVYYDTSAAACAACGLLEIAKLVEPAEKKLYEESAYRIFEALTNRFVDFGEEADGILLKSSAKYHREHDREVTLVYGDYFYVELVLRLAEKDFLIW